MFRCILISVAVICGMLVYVKGVGTAGEKSGDMKALAKERLRAARSAYQFAWMEFKPFDLSKGDGEKVHRWSRRWMQSERELGATKAERVAAFQGHFERMTKLEEEVLGYAGSTIPLQQLSGTQFYRANAEASLAKEKAR